jgi:hypothetical protein
MSIRETDRYNVPATLMTDYYSLIISFAGLLKDLGYSFILFGELENH